MFVIIYVCIYIYVYIYIYVHVCVCVYTYLQVTRARAHTHTHTQVTGADDCGQLGRGGKGDVSTWTEVEYGTGFGGCGGLQKGVSVRLVACGQVYKMCSLMCSLK